MNIEPTIIVGLWFLPVVLTLVFPLALLGGWFLWRALLAVMIAAGIVTEQKIHEKRAHQRFSATELRAEVSDGVDLFTGLTCNISRMGICITGLPARFLPRPAAPLAVVVNGYGEKFTLNVLPRWQRVHRAERRIGALIESSPDSWNRFVQGSGVLVR